jgi:hypothetical protein
MLPVLRYHVILQLADHKILILLITTALTIPYRELVIRTTDTGVWIHRSCYSNTSVIILYSVGCKKATNASLC